MPVGDGGVGGCGRGADGLADCAVRVDLGAVGLARSRLRLRSALRRRSVPSSAAAVGGLAGERSGGGNRRGGDRKRRGRLVGCWRRGSRRCRRCRRREWRRQRRRPSPRPCPSCAVLGRDRSVAEVVAGMPAWFRRTSRHRTSARRTSIWQRRVVPALRRVGSFASASASASALSRVVARRRGVALRAAYPMPPCPMRRRCRASGCRMRLASRRRGAARVLAR